MADAALTADLTDLERTNLEAVTGVHPFWNRRDADGVLEFYDDEIVWRNVAFDEVYEGKQAVREFLTELFAALPDLEFSVQQTIARGDHVSEQWTIRGTHLGTLMGVPPTGRRVELVGMSLLTMRDGKFLRDEFYSDSGAVMRQLGLLPSLAATRGAAGRVVLGVAVRSLNVLTRRGRRARAVRRSARR